MVGIPEDLGYILSRQDEITGSDPRIFDQLRQDFPKYLGVNSSQDAERSACGHQFQEGKWAADIEFPGRKKETPTRVVHFKGGLFAMPDLSGLAFCASQLFGQTGRGEARGFIGKGRGGGCPAGDDQVAFGKTVILFERGECKHVLIAVKAKLQSGSGTQTVQTKRMSVQGTAQLRAGIQPVKAVENEGSALRG